MLRAETALSFASIDSRYVLSDIFVHCYCHIKSVLIPGLLWLSNPYEFTHLKGRTIRCNDCVFMMNDFQIIEYCKQK